MGGGNDSGIIPAHMAAPVLVSSHDASPNEPLLRNAVKTSGWARPDTAAVNVLTAPTVVLGIHSKPGSVARPFASLNTVS